MSNSSAFFRFSLRYLLIILIPLAAVACGQTDYRQGKALYTQYCANCHMDDGRGLGKLIPPLAEADWLRDNQEKLSCLIVNGMEGAIVVNDTTYKQVMPGVENLSEFQIANIINYINHAWGNDYGIATVAEIREQLAACD